MENILLKYKQDNAYSKIFQALSHDFIQYINKITHDGDVVIMKEAIYNHFKGYREFKPTYNNIYVYKNKINQLYKKTKKLYEIFPNEVRQEAIEKIVFNENDDDHFYTKEDLLLAHLPKYIIDSVTRNLSEHEDRPKNLPTCSIKYYAGMDIDRVLNETGVTEKDDIKQYKCVDIIKKYNLNKDDIKYFIDIFILSISGTPKYQNIVEETIEGKFLNNLNNAIQEIVAVTDELKHLNNLFEVIPHIADMNSRQLSLFIDDRYAPIPYIKKTNSVRRVIATVKHLGFSNYIFEILLMTDSAFYHIQSSKSEFKKFDEETCKYKKELITFKKYQFSENTIKAFGKDIELTPHGLTLFEFSNYGEIAYKVYDSFKFNKQKFADEILTCRLDDNDGGRYTHEYLLSRLGVYSKIYANPKIKNY